MDDRDAVEALRRLGLSKYEAEAFVALQRLAGGTARDVARVTDVPRSQVYGAAEGLERRGLVEVERSTPMQYRSVDLEEAKARLRREFEREHEQAFEFLEAVRGTFGDRGERQEAIWTIRGRESVVDRAVQLARDAEEYVVYGSGAELLDAGLADALVDQAAGGVDVTAVSTDRAVVDRFEGTGVRALGLPDEFAREEWLGGRLLVADGDTVLLSVLGDEAPPAGREETAFWSAETRFAGVLVRLIDGWFGSRLAL